MKIAEKPKYKAFWALRHKRSLIYAEENGADRRQWRKKEGERSLNARWMQTLSQKKNYRAAWIRSEVGEKQQSSWAFSAVCNSYRPQERR